MCKATTYQYRCGAAFHTISSCEKQFYAGHSHSPDASSPDTNGASVKHHDSSTTSLLTSSTGTKAASTKSSFLSNGAEDATGFHSHADSQQHADLDAANDSSSIFTPLPTPVDPYPQPIHIHHLPSSLAPSHTITPERASSVLRSAQQKQQQEQHRHHLPHSDAVGHGLKSILPSRWLRSNNGATAAPEEKNEKVQVIMWQDAPEVRRAGVARGAVAVEGACPACAERDAREAAWAAMATFRGED